MPYPDKTITMNKWMNKLLLQRRAAFRIVNDSERVFFHREQRTRSSAVQLLYYIVLRRTDESELRTGPDPQSARVVRVSVTQQSRINKFLIITRWWASSICVSSKYAPSKTANVVTAATVKYPHLLLTECHIIGTRKSVTIWHTYAYGRMRDLTRTKNYLFRFGVVRTMYRYLPTRSF